MFHFNDPECPLVYDPGVEARAKNEIAQATLMLAGGLVHQLATSAQTRDAAGRLAENLVRGFYGMDLTTAGSAIIGMVMLETKLIELNERVRFDAEQLIIRNGCEGPGAKRFLGNIKAYMLGTQPIQSEDVGRRTAIRQSSQAVGAACKREFSDERFCDCALNQLLSAELDVEMWKSIEPGMREITLLPAGLKLREKMRACYG